MALSTHDNRLFGLDITALWQHFRRPWRDMHQWPVLAWLTPVVPVRLWLISGEDVVWLGDVEQRAAGVGSSVHFHAVELPEDILLRRQIAMPVLPDNALRDAIALDVASVSPFEQGDLAWGFSASSSASGSALSVEVVLASRKHIAQHIVEQSPRLPPGAEPEVWVVSADRRPIMLSGYGEGRRLRKAVLGRRIGASLLMLLFILLMVVALTPTTRLRMRAMEAVGAYELVQKRAGPLLKQRENVVKSAERLTALRDILSERVDPLRSMNFLTQVLPDDTTLLSLQVQGTKVSLTGQTVNTAALMQQLGTQAGVRDVRAPTPATKPLGTLKESFSIEFTLDPKFVETNAEAKLAATPSSSTPVTSSTTAKSSASSVPAPVIAPPLPSPVLPASKPAMTTLKG